MKLDYSELEGGIRLIKLNGVLDMNGTYSVEVPFVRYCAGENVRVIVDLSKVTYISSVGIPMLVNSAKSIVGQGGKMSLLKPQDSVIKVLEMVGIPQIIPIYDDLDSAISSLKN